jgi:hypothetical protein
MTTTRRTGTGTGIALALALAVSAAPASARPYDLDGNGAYVQAGSASTQAPSQPTRLPPILAAPKLSQQAALRQAQQQERLAYVAHHQPNSATYSSAEMNAYASATPTGVPSTVVRIVSHDGRFDWGDAGIGAAGGLGLALLGVGGAAAVSQQRRARRSKASVAITS